MVSSHLETALEAVKLAEEIILKYFQTELKPDVKLDHSPVTIADREAEEIIKQTIRDKFPDHTFYGEEGAKVDLSDHKGFTWIIDPIDGTKSYMRGNPLFATQLALLHDGKLVIGISNAPLLDELVFAERGHGCYMNGERVSVSSVVSIPESYMSFGSLKYFMKSNALQPLLSLAEQTKWARGVGDFWSYHLLAQGKLDVMIEAETKLWDIAAMTVIIEEAGGRVSQLNGLPVNHMTTNFLATNGKLHDEVLSYLKP